MRQRISTLKKSEIELTRTEKALQKSEEKLKTILDNINDVVFQLSPMGIIEYISPKVQELYGYKAEELIGKHLKITTPMSQVPKALKILKSTVSGKTVKNFEIEQIDSNGKIFYMEINVTPVKKNGKVIAVQGVMRDITERKRVNEMLQQAHQKLERRVEERTADLSKTNALLKKEITERKRAEEDRQKSFEKLRRSLESTVSALASALEMRDPYTAGHQKRATELACAIAEEMGLPEEQIAGIRMAGLIHDIGKINIPAEILSKPGSLKEIEYSLFKNHPQIGHDIVKGIEFPWPVAQILLQHHERMDGSGYPQGLAGKEIILEARILAVADIVEAIASHRPYRPGRGAGDALEEIIHDKGLLYDPEVVDACLRVFYEKGFTFEQPAITVPTPKIH
jgi:PAS domain S-box-containing protein/putative nucleotidyltransferase with HDIG domain